jgi:hypothetical protein
VARIVLGGAGVKYLLAPSALLIASLTFPGDALADAASDAREDIADAIDLAADDSRRCERRVTPVLDDVMRALRPRRITPLRARRALADLEDARDAARACDRRVRRLLRSASRALEALAEGGRYDSPRDRVRRPPPQPKKKLAPVPDRGWAVDCRTQWYMIEMIDMAGASAADRAAVVQIGNIACGNSKFTDLTWPNGKTARFSDGTWRYPNGKTARFSDGTLRYPNGKTARFSDGTWRYPNGKTAKFSDGSWRYPNGRRAGNWQSVENFACGASRDGCKLYRERRRSSDPIFSEMLLVREAWQAHSRR